MVASRRSICTLLILLAPAACGNDSGGPGAAVVTDSAGVRIVVNPEASYDDGGMLDADVLGAQERFAERRAVVVAGDQCRIEFDDPVRLGSLADAASLSSPERVDVAPLPGGAGWVVTDDDADAVHAYDPSGAFRGRYLPAGEGPGEISRPARASLDPTDSLWITPARSRAIVTGSGEGARTIVSAEQLGVDGHTPAGSPYSVRLWIEHDETGQIVPGSAAVGAVVMDREGNAVRTIGPVRGRASAAGGPPRTIRTPHSLAALNDSVMFGPLRNPDEPTAWVGRWTEEGVEPLVWASDVQATLVPLPDSFREPLTGLVLGLMPDGAGGAWGLARVMAVSDEAAEAIQQEYEDEWEVERSANPRQDRQPEVANRVHRTVLFRMDPDGTVTDAALTERAPRGFVDGRSYFALDATEEGLLQVVVLGFSKDCNRSGLGG